ncbi:MULTISPECIES: SAM-dependent methyltransferase [Streptomyces]|uniref:SAM-dependent methyltransferase n=1 Tax=Streptomyces abikoensis TaxID=97398 RepID=A0ABW7THT3_9ACTN
MRWRTPDSNPSAREFYQAKTDAIIMRYGPDPIIHYHHGYYPDCRADTTGLADPIRERLRDAQERLLDRNIQVLDAHSALDEGKLLDIGCGLGGPAIHWAHTRQLAVTALTNIADHAMLVRKYAKVNRVSHLVEPVHLDFSTGYPAGAFTAAVCVESSCYIPRPALFRHAAKVVKPGGVLCVSDLFCTTERGRDLADTLFRTCMGYAAEYTTAAEQHGFQPAENQIITDKIAETALHVNAWSEEILHQSETDPALKNDMERSIMRHARMYRAYREGALEYRIMAFVKQCI